MHYLFVLMLLGQIAATEEAAQMRMRTADLSKAPPALHMRLHTEVTPGQRMLVFVGNEERTVNEAVREWDARQRRNGLTILYKPTGWNNLLDGSYFWKSDDGKSAHIVLDQAELDKCVMQGEGITMAQLHPYRNEAIAWYDTHEWPPGDREVAIITMSIGLLLADRHMNKPRTELGP